jgi:hypothetical protein
MSDISAGTSITLDDIYATLTSEDMIISLDSPPRSHATYTPIQRRRARGRSHLSAPRRSRPVHVEETPTESDNPDKPTIPKKYVIRFDKEYVKAVLDGYESKGHLTLKFERLKYHPFLVSRDPKPPGTIAIALTNTDPPTSSSLQSLDPDPDHVEIQTPETDNDPEVINHGQDKATLALVAKLSEPEGLRSLRKRPASNPPVSEGRRRTRSGSGAGAGVMDTPRRSTRAVVDSPLKSTAATIPSNDAEVEADGDWEVDAEGEDENLDVDLDLDLDMDAEGEEYVEE